MRKLREGYKKRNIRNKLARIIVEEARKRNAGIVLEKLPKNDGEYRGQTTPPQDLSVSILGNTEED